MSMKHTDETAQCRGKFAYANPQLAHRAASRERPGWRGSKRKKRHSNVYRCPHCGLWHIGQDNGKVRS